MMCRKMCEESKHAYVKTYGEEKWCKEAKAGEKCESEER